VLFSDAIYCLPAGLLTTFDCPPCASLKGFTPVATPGNTRRGWRSRSFAALVVVYREPRMKYPGAHSHM
jgi:hypothetical protein